MVGKAAEAIGLALHIVFFKSLEILAVLGVIGLLWFALWKAVLEQNPIVRDFFDLDRKKQIKRSN